MPLRIPDSTTRQPRAERRRLAILGAALRVIAEGGPEAVTHRRVASEAGVPVGSTTYYFESRDALVREAFLYYLSTATRFVVELEGSRPPASPESLVGLLVEIVRREFSDRVSTRIEYELVLYAARDPHVARAFNAYERGMEALLAGSLERLGAPRPMDAARTLIDVVRGFEIEGLTRPDVEIADLERRLLPLVSALTASERRSGRADRRSSRDRGRRSA